MVLRHVIALALGLSAGGCAKLGMADPVGDSEDSGMPTSAAAADTTRDEGGQTSGSSSTTDGVGGSAGSDDASTSTSPETDDSTSAGEGSSTTDSSSCVPDPEPLGGFCPPLCTNGCVDNVCQVLCNAPDQCQTIDCPPGFACEVLCEGQDACDGGTVNCTDLACSVSCSDGNDACGDMHIYCGAQASCSLTCTGGAGPCTGTQLHCGSGPCTATCDTDINPTVNPADSCQLDNGCV